MNTRFAASLALAVCLGGIGFVWGDLKRGQSQLWLGGRPVPVTRTADPLLFWVAAGGKAALVAGVIALSLLVLIFGR